MLGPSHGSRREVAELSEAYSGYSEADLVGKPAVELAALVRAKQVTARDVVAAHLRRIRQVEPDIDAFVEVFADEALAEADNLAERRDLADLPLAGVPIAIKDNLPVACHSTRSGSLATSAEPSPDDHEWSVGCARPERSWSARPRCRSSPCGRRPRDLGAARATPGTTNGLPGVPQVAALRRSQPRWFQWPSVTKATGLRSLPCRAFNENQAWLQVVLTAVDLVCWTKRICFAAVPALARCEIATFRYRVLHVAARLTHGQRSERPPDRFTTCRTGCNDGLPIAEEI